MRLFTLLKSSSKLFLLSVVFLLFTESTFAQSKSTGILYDDLGVEFNISVVPNRVISLAPNLTEMIFKLGVGNKIVGNTTFGNYPSEAKSISKVGDLISLNYEKIVKLNPDLIFLTVEGNNKQQYKKLKQLGFKVFVSNPRDYLGIKKTFSDLGKIFHVENAARNEIAKWDKTINSIRDSVGNAPKKTAMFLISVNPLMAAGTNTFINQYLTICGLKNIVSTAISNYPIVNREDVLKQNPDFIIIAKRDSQFVKDAVSIFPEWKNLSAIKRNNIITIEPDLFFRPGPRFAEAAEKLFNQISGKERN